MLINSGGPNNPHGGDKDSDKRFRDNYKKIFGRTAYKKDKLKKEKHGQGKGNRGISKKQSE